ncbi:MAG TPA: ABC transporter substrate-binding protein [Dehalococcoidales bacterium]|nr:ABC transporter substrate-binding protein [Dehalococcoidales bacterium]
MKKIYILVSILLIVMTMAFYTGCSQATSTAAKTSTSAVKTTNTPTATTMQPVTGGVLRRIVTTGPNNLGYPAGGAVSVEALERLGITDIKSTEHPNLCDWSLDPVAKTMTWYVKKGITFSDGTVFDANALKFNFQQYAAAGRMTYSNLITSYDVVDDYTLRMNLNDVNNQLVFSWAFIAMLSPTAYTKNGADWCRQNAVTTGPFLVSNFQRDVALEFVRNPNYWMKGLPYLAGIKDIVIPDYMVASGMMQTKDADIWETTAQYAVDLQKKGLKVLWEAGGVMETILFDSKDPTSPFSNQLVRQAVEYAINRPDLANKVGYGVYEPATMMERKGLPGYIEGFNPRPFNPATAKDLLSKAGYPTGFKTTLTCNPTHTDTATAVKSYLADVGIDVNVNIVDASLATTTIYTKGWKGMALTGSGVAPSGASILTHYGDSPFTFRSGVEYKSPAYLADCVKMAHVYTDAEFETAAQATYRQASDDAMAIPLYFSNSAVVYQPYVHSVFGVTSSTDWNPREDWMEAH